MIRERPAGPWRFPPTVVDRAEQFLSRILFVSCNFASDYRPMVWGTYIRMRMLLEAASRAAEDVDLLLFVAPDLLPRADAVAIAGSIRDAWGIDVTVKLAPRSSVSHRGWSSTLRGLFDIRYQTEYGDAGGPLQAAAVSDMLLSDTVLVVAHRLDAAIAVVAGVGDRVPIAVNFDDVEHVAKARRLEREPRSLDYVRARVQLGAIRRAEYDVMRAARALLVCSMDEKIYLAQQGVTTRVDIVPNAVVFPPPTPRDDAALRTLMFIGSYGYEPNIEAAEQLITQVFPLVLARRPDARLLIAGARSERLPSATRSPPSVEFLGFVDDVATVYARAGVACCAIRAGGGTRIKIIEAAAWSIPTVSTPLGAEGLSFSNETEIVLAETTEQLAAGCVALLDEPERARAIGAAAHRRAAETYEHGSVVARLARTFRDIADEFGPGRKQA